MANNEAQTDIDLFNYLTNHKTFSESWKTKRISNSNIIEVLSTASKSNTGNRGEPDLIYFNENKRILILIENKDKIKDHKSQKGTNIKTYAVDGVNHYLRFFLSNNLSTKTKIIQKYLENYRNCF